MFKPYFSRASELFLKKHRLLLISISFIVILIILVILLLIKPFEKAVPGAGAKSELLYIASPSQNDQLSGQIKIKIYSNVRLETVQFKLDNLNLGSKVVKTPYEVTWDSTRAMNGVHSLSAIVLDSAGKPSTPTSINVSVNNAEPSAGSTFKIEISYASP